MYPRNLTSQEKDWLFYLLPAGRKGYTEYRKLIDGMLVIGEGRFCEGNYVLGYEGDSPDLSYASLPMFACGQIICEIEPDLLPRVLGGSNPMNRCIIQISVHEFFDNKIEYSISNLSDERIPDEIKELSRWSYSYWQPGKISPFENDKLHEYEIAANNGELVLAISEANRSIWLYDSKSEVNHIIPVTNFINELLRLVRHALACYYIDKKQGLDLDYIFSNLQLFTLEDIKQALIEYNKHWRKINLEEFNLRDPASTQ